MQLKEINNLLSLQTLQKIQDSYSTALGIPISIRNAEGEALTKLSNASSLWNLINAHPAAEAKLITILKEAIEKCNRTSQIVLFERIPDTQAFLAPITTNGRIIAYFIGGLVRLGNPNLAIAEQQANLLSVDLDIYLDAYLHLPLFTKERLEASANLIKLIASTIYSLDNKPCKTPPPATPDKTDATSERYKHFFEKANDGMYLADAKNGTIIDGNLSGARLLGYKSPKELIGQKIENLYVFPEDRQTFLKIILSKGAIENWVAHLLTAKGEEKYFEINATLIKDQTGREIIQGVFRDINPRQHRSI